MSNKIILRTDDVKEAVAQFTEDPGQDSYVGVILALANAYQQEIVFPVAVTGEIFQTIHDDEDGDFLSIFTDMNEAEMGPETDLALMSLEDLTGNIITEQGLSGFIINAFSDPVFVDRDAIEALVNTALSSPLKDVTINIETMDYGEMVDLAYEIEKGENYYLKDPVTAASIYSNVIDDDFEMEPDEEDAEELTEFRAAQAQAMNNLAVLHLTGYGVNFDPDKARELLEDAADLLNTSALCNLAAMAEDEEDYVKAAELYKEAALLGDAKGLSEYAELLMKGRGVEKDLRKAFGYFLKASQEPGGESAYYFLGLYYEEGLLGEKDMEKAGYYYELGADNDDVKSKDGYFRIFGFPYGEDDEDDEDEAEDEDMEFETEDERSFVIDMSKLPGGIKN